jgi:hypothetical protein
MGENIPKRAKVYQIATKLPNDRKIYVPDCRNKIQVAIKNTIFSFQGTTKFTQSLQTILRLLATTTLT